MLIVKQAVAASNHTDEYSGYLTLLAVERQLAGRRGAIRLWQRRARTSSRRRGASQNGYLVDYTIGVVTHNDAKSNGAMSGLVNGFAPQFAQLITSLAQLPVDAVTQLEAAQLADFKATIDDETAQFYGKLYADVRTAYAHSSRIGDMLAVRMAQQFPDKFPGDPSINAVEARVSLNDLLQEHSYLTTMMSDAGLAGRGDEAANALGAVASARADIAPVMGFLLGPDARTGFPGVWGIRDADLFAYANASDSGCEGRDSRAAFVTQFSALTQVPAAAIRDQVISHLEGDRRPTGQGLQERGGRRPSRSRGMQSIADQIDPLPRERGRVGVGVEKKFP